MKFLLFLLFLIPNQVSEPFSFKIKNYRDCPYKVTLKGYNNQIYKIIYLNPKESMTINGSVPYPYFKIKFEKNKNVDCGCTKTEDCPSCYDAERVWERGDDFELFLEVNDDFQLTRKKCSRV